VIRIVDLHTGGLGTRIAVAADCSLLPLEQRRFPDGERYLRLREDPRGEQVWIVADLMPPDEALMGVLLLAATLREQGAAQVGLVAPYLPYMRQDMAFHPGECVSARHMARLLGASVDALVTVDAHLHRIGSLDEVFDIPARNLSAASLLADAVGANIARPLLVGPDAESAQWVSAAAERIGCPWTVLEKVRSGDRSVRVSGTFRPEWQAFEPVLLDDVLSTGSTLVEACALLKTEGMRAPRVAVVHAIFAGDAEERLRAAGVTGVMSCDSLPHPSNRVGLAALIAAALREGVRAAG